ncbi:ATP-binding cassette domain-containing protein [Brevibacillus sp. DP1.3A]|uniref:ATP-binding cassette domain-containing protein n=1 Tax=Brevibacillus sp. DP1.3A TaxID=2738867 RepID=UPI00156B70BD|nr:ATP-binding cassette domain-containing protein [Brevibacillus sp. DP1.3A]UED72335.1 ATP-binding cassette domain-containing protein [Brevibacillus sp. DP1.3A]
MIVLRKNISIIRYVMYKVWKINKFVIILNLIIALLLAVQTNLNVFLTDQLVRALTTSAVELKIVLMLVGLMTGLEVLSTVLKAYQQHVENKFQAEFEIHNQVDLLDHLYHEDLVKKEDPQFYGQYHQHHYALSKYLETFYNTINLFQVFLNVILSLSFLFASFVALGFFVIIFSMLRGYIELKITNERVHVTNEINHTYREHNYFFQLLTDFRYHKEITLMQIYDYLKVQWVQKKEKAIAKQLNMQKKTNVHTTWSLLLSQLNKTLIIVTIAYLISQKTFTISDFVAITMAFSIAENSMVSFIQRVGSIYENNKYIESIRSTLVDNKNKQEKCEEEYVQASFLKEIRVDNLTFTYPNRTEPAIENIHMTIQKGQKIAILGDNAAGKSTLIKNLLGLYKAPHDTIFFDGNDLGNMQTRDLWNKTSVVFQDFINYSMSIRENLALSNMHDLHNDEKMRIMLNRVGLEKLTELPQGIDTKLGFLYDDATNLSGGQWQRLALCRAFMRDFDLLVLDEPTSALDPNSELEIFNQILNMSVDKTVIIISHRVGIASKVDQIYLMKEGKIIEAGNHHELIAKQGEYHSMWEKQINWYNIPVTV